MHFLLLVTLCFTPVVVLGCELAPAAQPVLASLYDGQLGTASSLCAINGGYASLGGRVVAEPENFYGHLLGAATIGLREVITPELYGFFEVELYRREQVLSSLQSTYSGLGFTNLGVVHQMIREENLGFGLAARLVLPTALGLYRHAQPLAADIQALAERHLGGDLWVHGALGISGTGAIGRGPAQPKIGWNVMAGFGWQPTRWFAGSVEAQSGFATRTMWDVGAVATALRFVVTSQVVVGIHAVVPLFGRERQLASARLLVESPW